MVLHPRTIAGVAAALACLGVAFSQRPDPTLPPPAREPAAGPPQVIGTAGCAATGCHGRPEVSRDTLPADLWRESLTRWIDRDPHARAYAVLDSALGKQITARLRQGDPTIPAATTDARCLACHTHPALATDAAIRDDGLKSLRAEGVNCEACHGPAERWQIAHTGWGTAATRAADLKSHGMADLNDWSVQAKTCVGCHVGAAADSATGYPVRDMTHDMIAAGHPRLEFDFLTFHQKLPKHWHPKHRGPSEADPGTNTLLTAWLVGQVVTEQAYCELSLDRLAHGGKDDPRRPLPEFAEWNCSQCHHNLVPAAWREAAAAAQATGPNPARKPGRPAWIGASAVLTARSTPQFGQPADARQATVRQRWSTLEDARKAVAASPRGETKRRVLELLSDRPVAPLNWEDATRTYAAFASLEAALRESGGDLSKETGSQLISFREALWGIRSEPARREHLDKKDPGSKGYQRTPDSRWLWEQPGAERTPVEECVRGLRRSMAGRLQHLPP